MEETLKKVGLVIVLLIIFSRGALATPIPDDLDGHTPCRDVANPARCYGKALSFFGVLCSAFAQAEVKEVLDGQVSRVVHKNSVLMCRDRAFEASLKYRERLVARRGGKKGVRAVLNAATQAWFDYLGALSIEEGEDMDAYLRRVNSLSRDAYVKIEELEEYAWK